MTAAPDGAAVMDWWYSILRPLRRVASLPRTESEAAQPPKRLTASGRGPRATRQRAKRAPSRSATVVQSSNSECVD